MTDNRRNSDAELAEITAEYRTQIERARGANRETLAAFCRAGEQVARAKALLSMRQRGAYGRWLKEQKLSKQWAHRLLFLHGKSDSIDEALAWGREPEQEAKLGFNPFTVDGAVALLKAWEIRDTPPVHKDGQANEAGAAAKNRRRSEHAQTERRVALLERYVARLQGIMADAGVEFPLLEN